MEKTEKIDLSGRPSEEKGNGGFPNCMTWIFGNEDSADNDMKESFEVSDEDEKED